jgi:hypothetical protein
METTPFTIASKKKNKTKQKIPRSKFNKGCE